MFFLGAAQFGVLAEILGAVPHAIVGRASSGGIATALGYLGTEARNAAADPPRSDFRTATRSRRRGFPAEGLGESPLDRDVTAFVDEAVDAAAYLSAFVRAIERSQMAEELSAKDIARERIAEADAYAKRSAAALRREAERAVELGRAVEAEDRLRHAAQEAFTGASGRVLIETPFWEKLPPRVLQLFREAHVDPEGLASAWDNAFVVDPVGAAAKTLRAAAEASRALSAGLEDWGPASEKLEGPDIFDA